MVHAKALCQVNELLCDCHPIELCFIQDTGREGGGMTLSYVYPLGPGSHYLQFLYGQRRDVMLYDYQTLMDRTHVPPKD